MRHTNYLSQVDVIWKTGRRSWSPLFWISLVGLFTAGGFYTIAMPRRSHSGPLAPLGREQLALRDRLKTHVQRLAADIGERNIWRPKALERSAEYLQATLEMSGYRVSSQSFEAEGQTVKNLDVTRPGTAQPEEIVVVGGHYDTVLGCPGANDNATGAAAVLEIARVVARQPTRRTVRFAAFVNEEPPFFQTSQMGSLVYARRARVRQERIVAMLSLETIGCYSDAAGSQAYPPPFGWFYPRTGNFVGFVGNLGSRKLVRQAIGTFRRETRFPSEGLAAPGGITGVGWSDHWAFWQQGYPAVMITDTALFRYPHYHTPDDTPDKIDYDRLARVVDGLTHVVMELAGGR